MPARECENDVRGRFTENPRHDSQVARQLCLVVSWLYAPVPGSSVADRGKRVRTGATVYLSEKDLARIIAKRLGNRFQTVHVRRLQVRFRLRGGDSGAGPQRVMKGSQPTQCQTLGLARGSGPFEPPTRGSSPLPPITPAAPFSLSHDGGLDGARSDSNRRDAAFRRGFRPQRRGAPSSERKALGVVKVTRHLCAPPGLSEFCNGLTRLDIIEHDPLGHSFKGTSQAFEKTWPRSKRRSPD